MAQQQEKEPIIVRGSLEWWGYTVLRGGFFRLLVDGIEDTIAVLSRFLLLMFIVYCGLKAGLYLASPETKIDAWIEMVMFGMQIVGLEGSIPGLARYADQLRKQKDYEGAERVDQSMTAAHVMTVLAIAEGAAHLLGIEGQILQVASAIMLVIRGYVITRFLKDLAKVKSAAPRVMSKEDHDRYLADQTTQSDQAQQLQAVKDELAQARQEQTRERQQHLATVNDLNATIEQIRAQVTSLETVNQSMLVSTGNHDQVLQNLQMQLQDAERETQNVTRLLEQKRRDYDLQNADLTTAKTQIAHLQNAVQEAAKTQTAQKVKRTAKTDNVTSIDQARVKHAETNTQKVSYQDVLTFMDANPPLKRAEVAAQLGIGERKVYDALTWQKEQQEEKTQTANA